MRTRNLIFVFAFSLIQACAPNAGPIEITTIFSPASCAAPKDEDSLAIAGNLDTYGAASYKLRFLVTTYVTNAGNADDIVVGGTILESKGRDGVVINAIKVTYTSDPPVPALKDYTAPIVLMSKQNTVMKYYLGPTEIIGADTAKALMALPENHPPVTLYAKIVFQGYMQRGGTKVVSGPAIYPILVTKLPLAGCSKKWIRDACRYPGQDEIVTGSARCCDGQCVDGGTTVGGVCTPPSGCE